LFSDIDVVERPPEPIADEARERRAHAWVPVVTTILAIAAAVAGLFAARISTEALRAKNDAILVRVSAADDNSTYEAHALRQQIYEAQLTANPHMPRAARNALTRVADSERLTAAPLLQRAQDEQARATAADEKGARAAHAYDVMQLGVVLLELSVAVVALAAVGSAYLLAGVAGLFAVGGAFLMLFGLSLR
jgi:hypothetical protein